MTTTALPTDTLTVATCRALPANTRVAVRNSAGQTIEEITVMRYGGFYRDSGVHTFAVRDPQDKFRLRSEKELGLVGSERSCVVLGDDAIDLTDSSLNMP